MRSKTLTIEGYELLYRHTIYEDGRVFNEDTGRWVQGTRISKANRYKMLHLSLKGPSRYRHGKWSYPSKFFKLHRVMAENFLPPPGEGESEVNHKDGNRANNAAWNLEWCTHSHNMREAYRIGIKTNKGEKGPNARLCTQQVLTIREMASKGFTDRQIVDILKLPVTPNGVKAVRLRVSWGHV